MVVVVLLKVRRALLADFRRYERRVAAVVVRHGGSVERALPLRPVAGAESYHEVRIVRFPTDEAFRAYSKDPQLTELKALRDKAIERIELFVGAGE